MLAAVSAEMEHSGSPHYACDIVLVGVQKAEKYAVHIIDLEIGRDEYACLAALVHYRSKVLRLHCALAAGAA